MSPCLRNAFYWLYGCWAVSLLTFVEYGTHTRRACRAANVWHTSRRKAQRKAICRKNPPNNVRVSLSSSIRHVRMHFNEVTATNPWRPFLSEPIKCTNLRICKLFAKALCGIKATPGSRPVGSGWAAACLGRGALRGRAKAVLIQVICLQMARRAKLVIVASDYYDSPRQRSSVGLGSAGEQDKK